MKYSDGRYDQKGTLITFAACLDNVAKRKGRAKDDFRVLGLSKSSNEVSVTETREMVTGLV